MEYQNIFERAKAASRILMGLDDAIRSKVIRTCSQLLLSRQDAILQANAADLSRMDPANPLYDRLQLTPSRLKAIASDLEHVASLDCPVDEEIENRTLPNGIRLRKVRVPFGVIGVIYEARPNVTFDVFSLCLKSGNACILKGGHDADDSNRAAISLIHEALEINGVTKDAAILLPSTHEATAALLNAVGYVDVCIPRGGRRLIDFVRDNARVPVIETGAGVVHAFFDRNGNLEMGKGIIHNAKTRRVSVCNALDTLLVDAARTDDLCALVEPLAAKEVELHADPKAYAILEGSYPGHLLVCDDDCWDKEWMDYKMGVKVVGSLDEAIEHISLHGSGHSETIITEDVSSAAKFQRMVDASCVYVNLPTSFTDGAQFGLGAEIGISTQKLGPRGPMGLKEITTTRYLLEGEGQLRP